jgi:SNF2 family DNA or RNA helicase
MEQLEALTALSVDTVEIEGWVEQALARLHQVEEMAALAEPEGFQGDLRPYQERGVGWLWYLRQLGLGACLADDMGLGKTIQAIALLLYAKNQAAKNQAGTHQAGTHQTGTHQAGTDQAGAQNEDEIPILPGGPALLICPTSVVTNWRREMERFAPQMRSLVHHGSNRLDGQDFHHAAETHDLIITSYGTARRDIDLLREVEWSDLILDEAQNIKNPAAKQSQAVRRISAANRIALTGTPVENRLLELWSIMEFLNPGYFGPRERFRRNFILPIERYNDAEQMAQLRRLVQPFLLRRVKTDPSIIPDLPEKNEMVVYCPLTGEQAALYQTAAEEILGQLEASQGIQRRGLVLKLLTKLKQICNHPAHFLKEKGPTTGRSGKLSRLTEMLDEALSVGDRALIFTQFVEMGELLKAHLTQTLGADVLFLHGGTSALKRDEMVQHFQQERGGPSIFILSLRAGGVGLNLTNANHVFHFDRWWNPAVENQATDRAFRIGQTRNVQVYKFVTAGTLEERINEMILSKQSLAENVIGSGEEWLTELDTAQLRDLLTLRRDEERFAEEDDLSDGATGAVDADPVRRIKLGNEPLGNGLMGDGSW